MRITNCINSNAYSITANKAQLKEINKQWYKSDCVNFTSLNPLSKLNNYSMAEYDSLNKYEIKFLRFMYKNYVRPFDKRFYDNAELIHEETAKAIKTNLDKRFGENNYVFIAIGRSLSSIGKVLGYKIGEENVKNIPLSCAHRFALCEFDKHTVKLKGIYKVFNDYVGRGYDDNIKPFKNYLNKIGLSADKINKSGKSYIISDYSFSGTSLIGAKKLFELDEIFGKRDNLYVESIDKILTDNNYPTFERLKKFLHESLFKKFSFVNQSPYLDETPYSIKNTKKERLSIKLFWFKLLDNEKKSRI